jgi:hypothetical protein
MGDPTLKQPQGSHTRKPTFSLTSGYVSSAPLRENFSASKPRYVGHPASDLLQFADFGASKLRGQRTVASSRYPTATRRCAEAAPSQYNLSAFAFLATVPRRDCASCSVQKSGGDGDSDRQLSVRMSVDSRLIYLLGRCARLNHKLDTSKRIDLDVVGLRSSVGGGCRCSRELEPR